MIKEQGSSVFRQENVSIYWCFLVQPTFSYYPFFLGSHSKLCLFRMTTNLIRHARKARLPAAGETPFTPEGADSVL